MHKQLKLMIITIIILLTLSFLDKSNAYFTDYYSYIGKDVIVCTVERCIVGKVESIMVFDVCRQTEPFSKLCIYYDRYYTMYLKTSKGNIALMCEAINEIILITDMRKGDRQ